MISDDIIHNSVLFRTNSNTNKAPFLVPIKDSISDRLNKNETNNRKSLLVKSNNNGLKADTIKRAIHDGFMAAAIGDLEWLKQTLKISSDIVLDPNGFTTLHLASIHGKINIMKFLLEEKQYDPNYPSKDGWRPVHLCISNKIGSKAQECLLYLINKGADINVKNDDDVYPLHMAASEGQIDCLKILLDLRADITVTDKRGQTPLDLARVWGHRKCAKLLSSIMWHKTKNELYNDEKLQLKNHVQEILKDVEKAHMSFYENDPVKSKQNFNIWLENQGFASNEKISQSSDKIKANLSNTSTTSTAADTLVAQKKPKSSTIISAQTSSKKTDPQPTPIKDFINDDDQSSINYYYKTDDLVKSQPNLNNNVVENSRKRQVKSGISDAKKKKTNTKSISNIAWNYSTKAPEKDYINNLKDFFPRDPYTCLPKNLNLVLLEKELRGMSLEEVKEFMNKNLEKPHLNLNHDPFSNKMNPNVVYKPKNIIDVPAKVKIPKEERVIDEAGFNLCNDKTAFPYKQATKFIERSQSIDKIRCDLINNRNILKKENSRIESSSSSKTQDSNMTDSIFTLNRAKNQFKLENQEKDEKLERIRVNYGSELSEFMKDRRHGNLSQKYEKVFIY